MSNPFCVVDAQILKYANSPVTSHVSGAQRNRWNLLRHIIRRHVTALKSTKLEYEYATLFSNTQKSEILDAFFKVLDKYGRINRAPFTHHHVAQYVECRFPKHDAHLLRTAFGIADSVISTDEPALLATNDCIRKALGIRVLAPANAIAFWGLDSRAP